MMTLKSWLLLQNQGRDALHIGRGETCCWGLLNSIIMLERPCDTHDALAVHDVCPDVLY